MGGVSERGCKIFMNFTEHVKIRNEKFGTVIFETLSEKIFITNGTGAKILELIGQGREAAKEYLKENPDISKKITDEVMAKIKVGQPMLAVGVEDHTEDENETN